MAKFKNVMIITELKKFEKIKDEKQRTEAGLKSIDKEIKKAIVNTNLYKSSIEKLFKVAKVTLAELEKKVKLMTSKKSYIPNPKELESAKVAKNSIGKLSETASNMGKDLMKCQIEYRGNGWPIRAVKMGINPKKIDVYKGIRNKQINDNHKLKAMQERINQYKKRASGLVKDIEIHMKAEKKKNGVLQLELQKSLKKIQKRADICSEVIYKAKSKFKMPGIYDKKKELTRKEYLVVDGTCSSLDRDRKTTTGNLKTMKAEVVRFLKQAKPISRLVSKEQKIASTLLKKTEKTVKEFDTAVKKVVKILPKLEKKVRS